VNSFNLLIVLFCGYFAGVACTLLYRSAPARRKTTIEPWLRSFRPFGEKLAFMCIRLGPYADLHVEGWGRRWKDVNTSAVCTGDTLEMVHKAFLLCCKDAQIDPETGKDLNR
jgi:hypothetical protein